MKYEISEDKIISVMKKYSEQNYPQILRPFNTKNVNLGKHNSGYGSSMDDYFLFETRYMDSLGNVWIISDDDRDISSDNKWSVTETLEGMYDMFGEENFEKFFLIVHNIDLKNKGQKEYSWLFWLEPINEL